MIESDSPGACEPVDFGALLRRYRLAAGLTQEELAERARLSARAITAYEGGRRRAPYWETVRRLAQALGLSTSETAILQATVPRRRGPQVVGRPPNSVASALIPPTPPRSNLPVQLTSFVGRQREIAEIKHLLGRTRLLTLTGAGGVGKTRLALQVAAEVSASYPDGVWVVELAAVADPAAVPPAIAAALEVSEVTSELFLARLQEVVSTRRLLLLLDNCEHLLDACATVAEELLRAGRSLQILATSREALRVGGELSWRVPSLALPDVEHLDLIETLWHSEAIQLFIERATAVQPHFALSPMNAAAVVHVCHQLDGIPLALELAAARLRGLSVEQLATRLDQRFQLLNAGSRTAPLRQQTLRATVDWSYGLLIAREQQLFNRLAVFTGGFTIEAAELVCGADEGVVFPVPRGGDGRESSDTRTLIPPLSPPTGENHHPAPATRLDVLDLLLRLVDKSLVVSEEGPGGDVRYRLLETLRQYGQERLESRRETTTIRARLAQYYLVLAEQAEQELRGPSQVAWMDRLRLERGNLGTALSWFLDNGASPRPVACEDKAEGGLRLASALHYFWILSGQRWEGRRWLERALTRTEEVATPLRAKGLLAAGHLARLTDDSVPVPSRLEESVALYRGLGEKWRLAYALIILGFYTRGQEPGFETGQRVNYRRGTALLHGSLTLAREVGDPWLIGWSLRWIAMSTDVHQAEERARGRAAAEESLPLLREAGDIQAVAFAHRTLGLLALYDGNYARAHAAFSTELSIARTTREAVGVGAALNNLGDVARARGDFVEAQEFYDQSLARYCEVDFEREWLARVIRHVGEIALERGDPLLAQARLRESLLLADQLGVRGWPQVAGALEAFAGLAAARGKYARAVRLEGAAASLRERMGEPLWPHDRSAITRWLAPANHALDEAERVDAWATGWAMTLEQGIAYALQEYSD
jgi:non-specific serine/threonine protein kinase